MKKFFLSMMLLVGSVFGIQSATVFQGAPQSPPVKFDFSTEDDFNHWRVFDANHDGTTWFYLEESTTGDVYHHCAQIKFNKDNPLDDWLIMVDPVALPAGENYISLKYASYSSGYPECFEVYYGETDNPEEMTKISGVTDFKNTSFLPLIHNFTLDTAKNLYFAIRATSEADKVGLFIDDIEIDSGSVYNAPDLTLSEVILPDPSSALTATQPLRVAVAASNAPIKSFLLTYSINDGEAVEEQVSLDTPIPVGAPIVVDLKSTADFSIARNYIVSMTASQVKSDAGVAEPSDKLTNNSASATTVTLPVKSMPFYTDFANGLSDSWASRNNAWQWSGAYQSAAGTVDNVALRSAGVELQAGTNYVFEINYKSGENFMDFYMMYANFKILYGKAGTDMSEWTVIAAHPESYTDNLFVAESYTITPTETGNYEFALICSDYSNTMYISSINISEKVDYEINVKSAVGPTMLPATLANSFKVTTSFKNMGNTTIDAQLNLMNGDAVIGSTSITEFEAGETESVVIVGSLTDVVEGETVNLTIKPAITGHDDATINEYPLQIAITKSTLAFDSVKDEDFDIGIGSEVQVITVGTMFELTTDAIVSGMSIGWAADAYGQYPISIYRFDEETMTVTDVVVKQMATKSVDYGFEKYDFGNIQLGAGKYLAALTYSRYALAADANINGVFYTISTRDNSVREQRGIGNAAIRIEFGDGTVVAKDLAIRKITEPGPWGIFTSNERVVIEVANIGYDATNGILTLKVDGKEIGSQSVELDGYDSGEFSFTADLATVGTHEITAQVSAAEDGNADNNIMTLTVESVEPLSPYKLDFENCQDFSIGNFNPQWTTVDIDQGGTYSIQDVQYPGIHEPHAFMVFNPFKTTPSMEKVAGLAPHGGERYAISCASDVAPNDDWLISPKMRMDNLKPELKFWVKSLTDQYGLETYRVLVSETDNNPESFKVILDDTEAPVEAWTEQVVDLSEYADKEVYLAIQCTSDDILMFMLDDITVTVPGSGISTNELTTRMSVYPNPVVDIFTVTTESAIQRVEIIDMNGRIISRTDVSGNTTYRQNASDIAPGIYAVKVTTQNGTAVERIIVK